jgi:hypothetical protein
MPSQTILQAYLDEVSAAVLNDDWETYRTAIDLPCAVISHNESKIVATEDDLRAGFDDFCSTLRIQRVTDYIRLVDQATMLDEDLISGSYISHIISGGQRILAPFRSNMTLRKVAGRWRAASVSNGLANSRWPLVRLQLAPEPEGPKDD